MSCSEPRYHGDMTTAVRNDATFLANVRTYSQLRTSVSARIPLVGWPANEQRHLLDSTWMRGVWLAMDAFISSN